MSAREPDSLFRQDGPVESFEDAAREIRHRVAAGDLDPNRATIRLLELGLEVRRGSTDGRSVRRHGRRG